ncbi:MAG: RNA-guided endonuclease InsQ/TnpB family protein [Paludibacter sp.]
MITVTKTIQVKVFEPTNKKIEALEDLLNISSELSKYYVSVMEEKETYSKKVLHQETYHTVKEQFKKIPTGLIQTIRDKAVEAFKSFKVIIKAGKKASPPDFEHPAVRFDARTFTLHKTDNSFGYFVSVSSREGRIYLPIVYGDYQSAVLDKISGGEYKFCTAELSYNKRLDCYILNISYRYNVEECETSKVMGVDMGINNYAVLAVPGQVIKFFGGKRHNRKREHYSNLRKELGKKKLQKKIKAIGNKENRYMKDVNHKISREIVKIAKEHNAVVQIEDLSNIRGRVKLSRKMNKQLHNWNFYQLQTFIEYKALAEGLKVIRIPPEYTSRMCHVCGHTEKGNRKSQASFKCKVCGYQAHADYNASVNIANYAVAG